MLAQVMAEAGVLKSDMQQLRGSRQRQCGSGAGNNGSSLVRLVPGGGSRKCSWKFSLECVSASFQSL